MACRVWAGHRQKILPRRIRILGKWLFRRLAVGNTIKALGFRNVLWESGPWKKFLKVLCLARNLRESGSFGKVSYYKVWPYFKSRQINKNNCHLVLSTWLSWCDPGETLDIWHDSLKALPRPCKRVYIYIHIGFQSLRQSALRGLRNQQVPDSSSFWFGISLLTLDGQRGQDMCKCLLSLKKSQQTDWQSHCMTLIHLKW